MRSCQWYDTGGFDPILLSYRRCTMPPTSSEDTEKVPGTEQGLGNALGFSLLELQEDSNLARRLNNKQTTLLPPHPPCHKAKYRKYHNRGPNTTLWEIKGKIGSLCIRDTCVAEVTFALSWRMSRIFKHRQVGWCIQGSRLCTWSKGFNGSPLIS